MKANGSQIIVKMLEMEGISVVAGIPGGSILPLYDELYSSSIKHVLVRQEQAAGFFAQGIARSTGKAAVCMATSGPGAMNLLTAIADARCDSVPIVAITGQVNTASIGTDAFQEADTFGLSFPITKHSMMIKDARELFTAIPEAFEIASTGRPGPVLIDIPKDVQLQTVEFENWPDMKQVKAAKKTFLSEKFCTPLSEYENRISKMINLLVHAKKPVLFTGGGCNTKHASTAIKEFLEMYECPVVSSLMGIGAVASSYRGNFGMLGMHGSYAANKAIYGSDLVFAIGVRFDDRATGTVKSFCPQAKIIHVDIDAAEINKIFQTEVSITGDAEKVLKLLVKNLKTLEQSGKITGRKTRSEWLNENIKLYEETKNLELGRPENCNLTNPRKFISELPVLAAKAGTEKNSLIVTTDVGQHQMWTAQYFPVEKARQLLTSGSLGTMGFGLPAAIGAWMANQKKRVICISGDGSILMNIQELATLKELNANVTVIVLQNGVLGMVKQQQKYLFEGHFSASIFEQQPDLLSIAKGFGIDTHDADTESDWYKKAFEPGPHFVTLKISPEENVLPFAASGKPNIDAIMN